jgi:hypothetical protein
MRAKIADNRPGPYNNAAHHTEAFNRPVARQLKRRGRQRMCLIHNRGK